MTAINLFRRLMELQPEAPLLTGNIEVVMGSSLARVLTPGGGRLTVRNPLEIPAGSSVFIRGDEITGRAPDLPYVLIEI